MAAVAGLEIGDVGFGRVGDEDLVTPPTGIEEGELSPRVRLFSSDDGSGSFWPTGEVEVGQLGQIGPLADLALCGDGFFPGRGGRAKMAGRTSFRISNPMENSMPRSTRASTKR